MPAYINDRFVNNEESFLYLRDLAIQRGYAVFDFFRTINGVPLFVNDHLNRFYNSAAAMHLPVRKSREEIVYISEQLINQSAISESGIRIMLTGGYSNDGYQISEPNLIITCNPVSTSLQADFERGYSVITYKHQRELPHIKSINYLMAVWLQPLLKEKQANDVLYFNNESITEFPRCNVFMVSPENKLVTPVHNILHGVTRKQVLSLAEGILESEERNISLEELVTAKEIFLTATTKKIIPVIKLNGQPIGNGQPGNFTIKLNQKFLQLENSFI